MSDSDDLSTAAEPGHALDAFDRRILARVQSDCHRPAESIAAEIGLSASAVQRRLRRLRERGVIRAEVALLDPAALGAGLTLIAGIGFEREHYAALARLRALLAPEPAVQQAYSTTGDDDLVVILRVADMPAYDRLCARWMAQVPQIGRITTQVVIEPLKVGLALPVPGGD
ncbi:Lrp/AsnC family transcriptional regulator [Sphaerotilus sulfidivorans]|jgi:DNA-binding Lrp family transcriptional regulator|uniref:Lrp/AsnC family transcriptional regulator n=1 Tax=Sphaerotilus sp. FB-3 TaxID=2913396 RepID=UPI00203EF43F|nr:Lrp/AsnC family transcriptional regulator [Sphaerotilus sp. FB-3]GKQ58524.1 ArsR family transcriptional regulator [Sphaerotilus sp. FB-3]